MSTILAKLRLQYQPKLPPVLEQLKLAEIREGKKEFIDPEILKKFSSVSDSKNLEVASGEERETKPLNVGVIFSGGQASGGHNVISGLYDGLQKLNLQSKLIGFLEGPQGLIDGTSMEINAEKLKSYRNQGGFDLIGSGRTKIETDEQFRKVKETAIKFRLDGLVIIGGDDSNTNAAYLAEYFSKENIQCSVTGIPKTIDGDLKNKYIEVSFGFDTACKIYAEMIGNLERDLLSAKKMYAFVKLMGRSASHIALESALNTHPNLVLVGEEVLSKGYSLKHIVDQITQLVIDRADRGKNYGSILIPEGIIEFIPDFKDLIVALNGWIAKGVNRNSVVDQLSASQREVFLMLPEGIQKQLLMDRDPHGNVQVSKIETEKLFIEMVRNELVKKGRDKDFAPQAFFMGYEGRSGFPSNFDADYCYALGHMAALSVDQGAQGYMATLQGLKESTESWIPTWIPIASMMGFEERGGEQKAVIIKALVDLNGEHFKQYEGQREKWMFEDSYRCPGPIQFFGPIEITDQRNFLLRGVK